MTTTTAISTITSSIARFFGLRHEAARPHTTDERTPRARAVDAAYAHTLRQVDATDQALFAQAFLHGDGAPIIAAYLDGTQTRHNAAAALSRAWNVGPGRLSAREYKWRLAETTMVADTFLRELTKRLDA